jgi:hypothetical protein
MREMQIHVNRDMFIDVKVVIWGRPRKKLARELWKEDCKFKLAFFSTQHRLARAKPLAMAMPIFCLSHPCGVLKLPQTD